MNAELVLVLVHQFGIGGVALILIWMVLREKKETTR